MAIDLDFISFMLSVTVKITCDINQNYLQQIALANVHSGYQQYPDIRISEQYHVYDHTNPQPMI